ncbi:hypothetical protein AMS60_21520 [Bacillus sp. FJAT-21945]|nr:hypothetical protein AMS60_21520 [Bacillus sp. FJAT-21945]
MKKKAIKIAASTAVAASAFVAAAPANKADAAVNVEKLVKDAESAAGALKWAISVEGTADGTTAPVSLYNLTKDANKAAQAAVAKTKGTDKVLYTARLQAVELQISRAMAYIDGITAGKKIAADTAALNAAIAAKDLTKVEAAYHKMTKEYRKQAALLDRVYGQSTRDVIRNATKKPAEAAIETVKIDVTVKMHLDAAAAATKAGDYKKAGESYAKAMEWFDKISATFKDQLTKSKDDVLAALPLQPVSISRVNDTTITVNFNKEVDALAVSHFTFDNGLAVVDAKLSADKKTATLTTTAHANNKTYTLSYKGVKTNLTFVKSVGTDNSNSIDADATAYVKVGASRVMTATFKNPDGTPYRGTVEVKSENNSINITAINGQNQTINGGTTTPVVPNADGKITLKIDASSAVNGKISFVRKDTNKEVKSGTTYFVEEGTNSLVNKELEVKYVDKANKFFVAGETVNSVTTNYWLSYDSNDSYYDHGSVLNQETFEKDLNKGNKIKVTYRNNVVSGTTGQSDFDIVFKKTITDIEVTTPSVDTDSNNPFRVAANQQFRLTGKGQAGYTVYLYRNDNGTYKLHGTTTVDGSGYWNYYNINLVKDELAGFRIIQKAAGESYDQILTTSGTDVWLKGGAFTATGLAVSSATNNNGVLDVNESVIFTTTTGDTVNLGSPLSLKLQDADLTIATYVHGVNGTKIEKVDGTTNQFRVTFGSPQTIGGGNGVMAGSFTVTEFQGITNQHGLGLANGINVSGL